MAWRRTRRSHRILRAVGWNLAIENFLNETYEGVYWMKSAPLVHKGCYSMSLRRRQGLALHSRLVRDDGSSRLSPSNAMSHFHRLLFLSPLSSGRVCVS